MGWLQSWAALHRNEVAQVLVLAVLLYLGLHFIRGTRGAGVLRGLIIMFTVIFVTASILTNIAGFEEIHYLLTQFLAYAALLLIIVVFQPELRHGLVRLGSNPFLRSLFRTEQRLVQEVAKSAGYLSRNRIGGLVVLARQVHLQSLIERGVRLDAEVSADLLNAIFQPTSPLEDGAVIIQHQRLAAACCILPLTENPSLSHALGTRHRAALGVTEESDAVAVVVSEQTGNISVAHQGQLTTNVDPDDLRGMLHELLSGEHAPREAGEEAKGPSGSLGTRTEGGTLVQPPPSAAGGSTPEETESP